MLTLTESFTNENLEIEKIRALRESFFERFARDRTSRASSKYLERLEIDFERLKAYVLKAKIGLFGPF